jgi:trans-aconitate methyltransferase
MYGALADWFHVLTPPEEYGAEAAFLFDLVRRHARGPVETLLELGSGGGNAASHLRDKVKVTLSDLSPDMLVQSERINPGVEHVVGDMRTLRLDRTFDAVLIHDAIVYMTSEADLRAALTTAFEHLRPGGAAAFAPDHVLERFKPSTDHGGEDGPDGRSLRYLEWTTDPDPTDTTYVVDYALLLRDAEGFVRVEHDRHVEGLFPVATWVDLLQDVGFEHVESVDDEWQRVDFVGRRPRVSHP